VTNSIVQVVPSVVGSRSASGEIVHFYSTWRFITRASRNQSVPSHLI